MKAVRSLVALACSVFAILSASAAWTIDDSDTQHILISDGTWTFDVGKKGSYPSFAGALKTVGGFQLRVLVGDLPSGAAAETLDFSTFKEDTRAKQAEMGLSEPYGVASSILSGSVLSASGIKTLIAPDMVSLGALLSGNTTVESVSVSPDFINIPDSMLNGCAALKTFSPTLLPNVLVIGKSSFRATTALTGDFVFANVTQIKDTAFYEAKSITSYSFPSLTSEVGTQVFYSNVSLKSFSAPNCTSTGNNMFLYGCSSLGEVTLSPDLSYLGSSAFSGCTALTNLTPKTFPLVTSIGASSFGSCKALRGTLSFPEATSVGSGAFGSSAIDEVDMPKAPMAENLFYGCTNIRKVTLLGSSGTIPKNIFNTSAADGAVGLVVHWLGDDVPTGIAAVYSLCGANQSRVTISLHAKTAQDGWVAQWATRLPADFTDADISSPTYPGPKATLAYCNPSQPVGNYFWLAKYIEMTTVTFVCPDGVEVVGVRQEGFPLQPNPDGTYEADASMSMSVTYRPVDGWVFADSTTECVAEDVAVAAIVPASTCPKPAQLVVARIGDAPYASLQAAFDVGGDIILQRDVALEESVRLADGKAVRLNLNGKTLTAAGQTAFAVAGTLEVRNGTVLADRILDGDGTFVVKDGVYSEDVTSWCAAGFHVVELATEPKTWQVLVNTYYELSLALADLVSQHIADAVLSCDGEASCVTNAGVVVWTLPESMPYALTYVAEANYLFGTEKTAVVSYPDGLVDNRTVEVAELPTPEKHSVWTWNEQAQTLTDGNWTFTGVKKNTDCGYEGLQITAATFTQADPDTTVIDFSTCADTTGWPVIAMTAAFGKTLPATKLVAPDLVHFGATFSGNTNIEEVTVSPDVQVMSGTFNECSALRKITPTKLPNLQFAKKLFYNCPNLEGDFELDAWTEINQDNPFTYCAKVTSLKLPNLTSDIKNMSFGYMTALTNFYAPKLAHVGTSMVREAPNLTTFVMSDAVDSIGNYAFYNCPKLESFYPTVMTNLTNLGEGAFSYDSGLTYDFEFPLLPLLTKSVFRECGQVRSVKAPLAELKGAYAFYYCTNLVSLTVKGGMDLGGDYALGYVCPNLVVDWIGRDIPAAMKNWALCGVDNGRIQICVHDPDARQAWLDAYATRLRKNFTADDKANPTYPGKYAKGVHATGLNWYWITRPPSGLGFSVIVK